jgi:hypothetical protein
MYLECQVLPDHEFASQVCIASRAAAGAVLTVRHLRGMEFIEPKKIHTRLCT